MKSPSRFIRLAAPLALAVAVSGYAEATTDLSRSETLQRLQQTRLTTSYEEAPIGYVLQDLQQATGVEIKARYESKSIPSGIDPETPITLHMRNAPALTVLEEVLSQTENPSGATWQYNSWGEFEVGSKRYLSRKSQQVRKIYDVRDLLINAPNYLNSPDLDLDRALSQSKQGGDAGSLVGEPEKQTRTHSSSQSDILEFLITDFVEPGAWQSNGGDWAKIQTYKDTLIITGPNFIHRKIK